MDPAAMRTFGTSCAARLGAIDERGFFHHREWAAGARGCRRQRGRGGGDGRRTLPLFCERRAARAVVRHGYLHGVPRHSERSPASPHVPDDVRSRHGGGDGMSTRFDVVVVGAGPGGMAAATVAAEAGCRVCMLDDNASKGGQIWRGFKAETARKYPYGKAF